MPCTAAARLAAHAGDVVQSLNALKVESYFDVMFAFHAIFNIPPYRFHAYQIQMLLSQFQMSQRTSAEHNLQLHTTCAGPGMVPMALLLRDRTGHVAQLPPPADEGETLVEQALDDDDDGDDACSVDEDKAVVVCENRGKKATKFDDMLNGITVAPRVTSSDHHQASLVCKLLAHLLKHSAFADLCGELCEVDLAAFITQDLLEYGICEHRRLVTKAKIRRGGRRLPDCIFVASHRTGIATVRKSICKQMRALHAYRKPKK